MNKTRTIALGLTVLIGLAILIWLRLASVRITQPTTEWPPRHDGEIAIADEQFFDVFEDVPHPSQSLEQPSQVQNEVAANNASDPAPKSGTDTRNSGTAGDAPATATSKQPSPVKSTPEQPTKTGPSQEELDAKKTEEARREANAAMTSAFQRTSGPNNTSNQGLTPGNSGSPSGAATGINGTGTGSVGGGWSMPAYAKVPANVTGSIKIMVKIDKTGKVTSVSFQGGDAPAATDRNLRNAVEKEVRSRRFTRGATPAPDEATAYITYRFR